MAFDILCQRIMNGAWSGLTIAPTLNALVSFTGVQEETVRSVAEDTSWPYTLQRTGNTSIPVRVNWAVTGITTNPVTGAYFVDNALPSGYVDFKAGDTEKQFSINLSAGASPTNRLTGLVTISTTSTNSLIDGATTDSFYIKEDNETTPADWLFDPLEPTWHNTLPIGSVPNRQNIASVGDFAAINNTVAGNTYVVTANINLAGGSYYIDGVGTSSNPIRIRGNTDVVANYPELKNGKLYINGAARHIIIEKLKMNNVEVISNGPYMYVQIERNHWYGFGGDQRNGMVHFGGSNKHKYLRVFANTVYNNGALVNSRPFLKGHVVPDGAAPNDHWWGLWFDRNRCENILAAQTNYAENRVMAYFIGEGNNDSDRDCHIVFRHNLTVDHDGGENVVLETKLRGFFGENTWEGRDRASWGCIFKLRFGCNKPAGGGDNKPYGGSTVRGNVFVVPKNAPASFNDGQILVKDGYHTIINNWMVKLDLGEQPSTSSIIHPDGYIGLNSGDVDWSTWPKTQPPALSGKYFPNAAYCKVGGNRCDVRVGYIAGKNISGYVSSVDPYFPADHNVTAGATTRTDRNYKLTLGADFTHRSNTVHAHTNTDTSSTIADADYSAIPHRMTDDEVGPGYTGNIY